MSNFLSAIHARVPYGFVLFVASITVAMTIAMAITGFSDPKYPLMGGGALVMMALLKAIGEARVLVWANRGQKTP